jgi:hypothetical protein
MHACMHACVCVCVYIYTHTQAHIHVYQYTDIIRLRNIDNGAKPLGNIDDTRLYVKQKARSN